MLKHGAGGESMNKLIDGMRDRMPDGGWMGVRKDSAYVKHGKCYLAYTTDSFTVKPLFFPGGDIGKLAVAGTVNDLAVMGADPIALSLAVIVEEGFPCEELGRIITSVGKEARKTGVPVVTGDTKVMGRGELDGILLNTSGIGKANTILDGKIARGDVIIVSAPVGEHEASLLASRFNYKTGLKSDCKSLLDEMRAVRGIVKTAKDPTRGGLVSALNDIAVQNNAVLRLNEERIPVRKPTKAIAEFLGVSPIHMACEGVFTCVARKKDADRVVEILREYNPRASVIGTVEDVGSSHGLVMETSIGGLRRIKPSDGTLNPRIC
ncbi:MAG: hydrogenase expression/formation protein HypE [Candidatus Altiarchaeota archaeon]